MIQPETENWQTSRSYKSVHVYGCHLCLQIKVVIFKIFWTRCDCHFLQHSVQTAVHPTAAHLTVSSLWHFSAVSVHLVRLCLSATRIGARLISLEKINTVCLVFFSLQVRVKFVPWSHCWGSAERLLAAYTGKKKTTKEKKHYLVILCPLAHAVMQEHLILVSATFLQARPIITL